MLDSSDRAHGLAKGRRLSAKPGGVGALIGAVTDVISLAMFAFVLSDDASGGPEPAESVAILADNHAAIFNWNLITLIVFSVVLVVLALADTSTIRASPAATGTPTVSGGHHE